MTDAASPTPLCREVGLGGHGAHQELQSSIQRLQELINSLKLTSSTTLPKDKFHDLAKRQGHTYGEVVMQQDKPVRKYRTTYGVQRNEMLRQIRHRIDKLEAAQTQPEMLSLQHLSSLETALQPQLHLLGYKWATTLFEFNIADGEPLAAMDEHTRTWLQDRSARASSEVTGSSRSHLTCRPFRNKQADVSIVKTGMAPSL